MCKHASCDRLVVEGATEMGLTQTDRWLPGDVVLAADGAIWCRASEGDIELGLFWDDPIGYETGFPESYPNRPLTLLVRNGKPVRVGCCLHHPCSYGEVESGV